MNEADALDIMQAAVWTVLVASGPAVLAAMVVGVTIALIQAAEGRASRSASEYNGTPTPNATNPAFIPSRLGAPTSASRLMASLTGE